MRKDGGYVAMDEQQVTAEMFAQMHGKKEPKKATGEPRN